MSPTTVLRSRRAALPLALVPLLLSVLAATSIAQEAKSPDLEAAPKSAESPAARHTAPAPRRSSR